MRRALAADPVSAYGGVVVLNRAVSATLGISLTRQFIEVLFAPGFDEQAMEVLARKPSTRVLNDTERRAIAETERNYSRVLGGLLVQDRDWDVAERDGMDLVCGELTERAVGRPALCVEGREARHFERDRPREGATDDRCRSGADESRRRSADRGREGARSSATTWRAPCSRRTRSSPSPTGRRLRSKQA